MPLITIANTKPMTAAMKKADDYRDQMNMGRDNVTKIRCEDLTCVVYKYTNINGQPAAICYRGRALKPIEHYRYRDEESREQAIAEFMARYKMYKATRRSTSTRALNIGDILKASWGYDQTNIDYFLILGLVGKTMVELVEIGADQLPTDDMQGKCIPNKTKIIGEPMRRKVNGESVTIDSCRYASLKKHRLVAGVEIYDADSWSSYA